MSMYDEFSFEETYNSLLNVFSRKNVSAFLTYFFSKESMSKDFPISFEKFIYIYGDKSEVYTLQERNFIENVSTYYVMSEYEMKSPTNKPVTCRIIAIKLKSLIIPIRDEIAIMKICNKAFDSYNVYLLVDSDSIYLGADSFSGENWVSNVISHPIKPNIQWDKLLDNSTIIVDDKDFLTYYSSVLEMIDSIADCYIKDNICDNFGFTFDGTDQTNIGINSICDCQYSFDSYEEVNTCHEHDDFYDDVCDYQDELKNIKSSRVNTIELLLNAENNISDDGKAQSIDDIEPLDETQDERYNELLHTDPEMLIKIIKKNRGGNK